MQWAKPKLFRELPPLNVSEDKWILNPLERTETLRDIMMTRFNASHDLIKWETGQYESIPWNKTLSTEDVKLITIGTGNKSSGTDKITFRLLPACWEQIGDQVKNLFQACLQLGHLPTMFRVAEIILLPKPGRDLVTAKGWRSISLLYCLGKGLERIVAKRMAWLAIEH